MDAGGADGDGVVVTLHARRFPADEEDFAVVVLPDTPDYDEDSPGCSPSRPSG